MPCSLLTQHDLDFYPHSVGNLIGWRCFQAKPLGPGTGLFRDDLENRRREPKKRAVESSWDADGLMFLFETTPSREPDNYIIVTLDL